MLKNESETFFSNISNLNKKSGTFWNETSNHNKCSIINTSTPLFHFKVFGIGVSFQGVVISMLHFWIFANISRHDESFSICCTPKYLDVDVDVSFQNVPAGIQESWFFVSVQMCRKMVPLSFLENFPMNAICYVLLIFHGT